MLSPSSFAHTDAGARKHSTSAVRLRRSASAAYSTAERIDSARLNSMRQS
ncbi:hypothetical protein HRTV-11_gp69 [Halorubrum virus HRTV-11]|nr:hypothetical protein HRTV-11_gp69 [Halorubrum virus HRTV-11]